MIKGDQRQLGGHDERLQDQMRDDHRASDGNFFKFLQNQSSTKKEAQEDKIASTRAEMGEVRKENERLKTLLSRMVEDHRSLQKQFDVLHQQGRGKNPAVGSPEHTSPADGPGFISLRLGTSAGTSRQNMGEEIKGNTNNPDGKGISLGPSSARGAVGARTDGSETKVGPDVVTLSPGGSSEEDATTETTTTSAPSKAAKIPRSTGGVEAEEEVAQQPLAKKARVSVRARCDTPTMNDGCQWRKYGQKISKGNPCPRAYYRCTVAPSCPVRKQVQRCADDMSILITTYEGTHSHPLPPAAAAMASTTSAAASMLLAGSSSSSSHGHHLPFASAGLLGPTTISTIASCPTVTLDLTAPHSLMQQQYQSPYAAAMAAGYESKALPAAWSSGYLAPYGGGLPFYGKSSLPAMGQHFGLGMATTRTEQLYGAAHSSSYLQRTSSGGVVHGAPAAAPAVTDTIAKAITSDPSFQSVLAAAITSYMGRGAGAAAHK